MIFPVAFNARVAADCDTWHALGDGFNLLVGDAVVYNGELYVSGEFNGASYPDWIARWDEISATWQTVGGGVNDSVNDLRVYNGELIATGWLTNAGGTVVNGIARWNGEMWQPLGSGFNAPAGEMIVFENELVVCGSFTIAGGVAVDHVARWNGVAWQPMGQGSGRDEYVCRFAQHNGTLFGGRGHELVLWNGSDWQLVDEVPFFITALGSYNGDLIVAGYTSLIGADHIFRWDSANLLPMGVGLGGSFVEPQEMIVYNGELIVAGVFDTAGNQPAKGLARWNGAEWSGFDLGINGQGSGLGIYEGDLIVGGYFTIAGAQEANNIAAWRGCNPCLADIDKNDQVDVDDLLAVINAWGDCPDDPPWCSPDYDSNYQVNAQDLGAIIIAWGECNAPPPAFCYLDIEPCGGDGVVGTDDLLKVINSWGPWEPPPPPPCPCDISHDGNVGVDDLLMVINEWGPCE